MAKLALKGNEAGSGTVVIQAPPSDEDVAITLPTRSGTLTILPVDIVNFEVNGVKFGDDAMVTEYALCTTAAATVEKTVTVQGFTLKTNAMVTVKFGNGNTATNPTLNVSGTGAKNITVGGGNVSNTMIKANDVCTFVYDGSSYCMVGGIALRDAAGNRIDSKLADLTTKYNDLLKRVAALESK